MSIEGDLVRPLGFVTLHWAYAEAQLDEVVTALRELASSPAKEAIQPFGPKISEALCLLGLLKLHRLGKLESALQDAHPLISERNDLVHGQLFNGGRLATRRGERQVTAQEITALSERILLWKEVVWVEHCRELLPMLEAKRKEVNESERNAAQQAVPVRRPSPPLRGGSGRG